MVIVVSLTNFKLNLIVMCNIWWAVCKYKDLYIFHIKQLEEDYLSINFEILPQFIIDMSIPFSPYPPIAIPIDKIIYPICLLY